MHWSLPALLLLSLGTAQAGEPSLQALAREHVGVDQGVFVRAADGTVLVEQRAAQAVHPASVTKVATTLALLARLGADYRFITRVAADGPVANGALHGNLIIEGGRDPFFVFESAFMLLRRLRALGIHFVDGELRVRGALLFNWQPDAEGRHLARALAGLEGRERWAAVPPGDGTLRAAALGFGHHIVESAPPQVLITYRSPPLTHVMKAFNCFSNNVFHLASEEIGGPPTVQRVARAAVPREWADEIVIDNAAGAGETNRMSPRAAVALLDALAREATRHGLTLTDLLPVSGIDPGTLEERFDDDPTTRGLLVGKTGTFGSVGASGLAGVLSTPDHGAVTFAVLHHGLAVPEARQRQDAFVRALARALHAEPWPYHQTFTPGYTTALLD